MYSQACGIKKEWPYKTGDLLTEVQLI